MNKPKIGMKVASIDIYRQIRIGTITAIDYEANTITVHFPGSSSFGIEVDYDAKSLSRLQGLIDETRIIFGRNNESDDQLKERILSSIAEYQELEYFLAQFTNKTWMNAEVEIIQEVTSFVRAKLAERGY